MKLLIALGVVAVMFFAQAADVNAATCEEKAYAWCRNDDGSKTGKVYGSCTSNISCNTKQDCDPDESGNESGSECRSYYCKQYCN